MREDYRMEVLPNGWIHIYHYSFGVEEQIFTFVPGDRMEDVFQGLISYLNRQ